MPKITNQEFKYIIRVVIFSLIWFLILVPYLLGIGIENSNPYTQFLIFNIGIFLFLQVFLKANTLGRGIDIKSSLGILFLFIAIDTITPPFLLSSSGELLNSVVLKSSGSDWIAGYFAINSLGLSGINVFLFTYIFVPALLFFISANLLKNMVRNL